MENGVLKKDHNTGIGLVSVFGRQIRFDLSRGFPLLTTKKVYWNGVVHELVWFMRGMSNIKYLVDNNVHIWDDYPYKDFLKFIEGSGVPKLTKDEFIAEIKNNSVFAAHYGELPHIYGSQWRRWKASDGREIDQLAWALETCKKFPDRKHAVVTSWQPEHMYAMARPGEAASYPLCHILYHFNVAGGKLSCQLYQRSADVFLGVPFNIASYAALTVAAAHLVGLEPGEFIHTFGDVHIYENHLEQVREQLSREPRPFPELIMTSTFSDLDLVKAEDFILAGYRPHPPIKGELTVAGGFDEKDREKFAVSKK